MAVHKVLILWLDVVPKLGRHEAGEMPDVAGRYDELRGSEGKGKRLGRDDHVSVKRMNIGGGNTQIPGLRPEFCGFQHDVRGDW